MARPRRISDEEILRGVRSAVLEQGPHVSIDVVAERLGVTAPALFRRFGSRQDLLTAALRLEARPPFIDDLERGPDGRPAQVQLIELFTRIGTYLSAAIPCMSAMRESGIPADLDRPCDEPPPLRAVSALSGWLTRARAAGLIAVDEPEVAASAMLGAIQAPIFFRHLAKQTDPWDAARHAQTLARLFLGGIAPPPASSDKNRPRSPTSRRSKEP